MYKLEFTLKQHTPIIHFQHDQDGATLRATEVKPKLDRYLIEKLGLTENVEGKQRPKNEFKHFFINDGKQHLALDYKIRIDGSSDLLSSKIEKGYPNYLGNMGSTIDEKGFKISDEINVGFNLKYTDLSNYIRDEFSNFLTINNFGNRKSKGFGCFSFYEMNEKSFESQLKNSFQTIFKLTWKNSQIDLVADHKYLFRKIQDEYKVLKAGDSRSKKESKLRQYVNELDIPIEWEKPIIQTDIAGISRSNLGIEWNNKNFHYVRALLGLADHFEYLKQKIVVNIKPIDDDFERFMSPILFKVFANQLYVTVNPECDTNLIRGKVVKISYKHNNNIMNEYSKTLNIPDFDFKVDDFLNKSLINTQWRKI